MIPLHGKPILEFIINGLVFAGFENIIIVVGYRKEQIIEYFKEGDKWGIKIEYIEQKELNGTGGALLICEDLIKEDHFFLTWGDILVSYDVYKEIINTFEKEDQDFILTTNFMDDPYKGAAVYSEGDYCIGIIEKPGKGKSNSNLNNCGIFIFSKEIFPVLKNLKPSKRGEIELSEAINYGINQRNWKVRIVKMEKDQFRGDFGNIKVYEQMNKEIDWLEEFNRLS